jgi:signal transduction histidine kinase
LKKLILSLIIVVFWQVAYSIASKTEKEEGIGFYLAKAYELKDLYNYDLAVVFLDSVIHKSKKTNNQVMLANALLIKGDILALNNQYNSAKINLIQALSKAESIQNDTIKAGAETSLSLIYQTEGNYDSALHYSNSAFDFYESKEDTGNMIKVLVNRSKLYQTWGEYDQSLQYALESNNLAKSGNLPRRYLRTVLALGDAYEVLKVYDTALSCYEMVYNLSLEQNDLNISSQSLAKQAFIYFRLKNYVEAKAKFIEAIETEKRLEDHADLAMLYSNISLVYEKLGQDQQAIKAAGKAVEISKEINHISRQTKALLNLGYLYKLMKNYDKAERYYNEGLKLAEQSNFKTDMRTAYLNLYLIYEEVGDYRKALEYFEKYDVIKDSILNESKVKAIEELEAKYESKEKEANILRLQNEAVQNESAKNKMQKIRNITIIISVFVILFFAWAMIFFRMKANKNRVISAQKIKQLEDEKKLMAAQSVLIGQEEERKRVAQELHDGIGVLLSTASIHFSGSIDDIDDLKSKEMVLKANKILKEAASEVRKISHNMMPGVLSKFGLQEALEDLFDGLNESDNIHITYDFDMPAKRLPDNPEMILYRVVQELTNNTLQHARAERIWFSMRWLSNMLVIDYSDNGIGFNPESTLKSKSLGFPGIHTRIEYLKGRIELESSKGHGTTYKIMIPVSSLIH